MNDAMAPLAPHQPRRASSRIGCSMRRRLLLVGGDHPEVVICTEYFRLRLGGDCEVESIAYCDDALQARSERRFDLMLLLSVFARWRTLPSRTARFGGFELLKRMQALDIQVPVLVVSASLLASRQRGIRFYRQAAQARRSGRGLEERLSWPAVHHCRREDRQRPRQASRLRRTDDPKTLTSANVLLSN